MNSLINIIPRKNFNGEIYFQTRFFDKNGRCIKAISFPEINSRAKAYFCSREKLEHILIQTMPKDEIEQYGILSIEEVKRILALPVKNQNDARNILIALLGITCGLGVSEIRNLKWEQIKPNDMLLIKSSQASRLIPFIINLKGRLNRMNSFIPDSLFVIPNISNKDKPCDPISITRGLSSVLTAIKISKDRNIVPSNLWETFINLLVNCNKEIEMNTIDYLCGFHYAEPDELKRRTDYIFAIQGMMMKLNDLKYVTTDMNWFGNHNT